MAVWKGGWSIGWLKSCTERVCIMNVRLVCAFASSSCIGTEPAAYVEENVESENTDFRAVPPPVSTADDTRRERCRKASGVQSTGDSAAVYNIYLYKYTSTLQFGVPTEHTKIRSTGA